MPLGPQVSESVEMSIEFVESLEENIAKNLKVRCYPQEYGIYEKERWLRRRPEAKFSEPEDDFESEIQGARLVVVNYNATALLEAVTRNIPTVMYWNFDNWELSPESEFDFQELVRMNILFPTSKLCSLHVNSIWPQLESWWNHPERVAVLDNFRRKYAYVGTEPYKEFASRIQKCSRL
jgi:putative transferase (TIGR04331 family)